MTRRKSSDLASLLLVFLLVFRSSRKQVNGEESHLPPDALGGDDDAFFALRSCHQLLAADSGDFFSPDYLCSSPSLWCNWTVQVHPGKRIHLQLEDLTPEDACHLKRDQVHVDEPAAPQGLHRILQGCWREATFTTASNAVTVVLLVGGRPPAPYRGFYARYRAFGPPVIYNPQEVFAVRGSEPLPGPEDSARYGPLATGQMEPQLRPAPADFDPVNDYYHQRSALTPDRHPEVAISLPPPSGNYSHTYPPTAVPAVPASTSGTSRSERGVARTPPVRSDPDIRPTTPPQGGDAPHHELRSPHRTPAAARRNAEQAPPLAQEARPLDPSPSPSEPTHPQPSVAEQRSDHRGHVHVRNQSEIPHLPGDHLFEVAVEVKLSWDVDESWDAVATSLLPSLKTLISERLEGLHTPASVSSKRIKRLHAGVLYILWLQMAQASWSQQVHRRVHAAMDRLPLSDVGVRGKAVILSVSTADVNECGTQMVLCDANADCADLFGSYSCRCRPGFLDRSRLGTGGTVCVDATGCGSGLWAETRGVYVLFFLLSFLVLMLLAAGAALYHRHRRGTFLLRCDGAPPDPNNNNARDSEELPPPPPPRGPHREAWPPGKEPCPAVDLPLLRFSPLLPPDGYLEPREGGKK